jgi:hypothetical protein
VAGGKAEVSELVKYEAAKFALSECVRVDEVKDIRDKSAAIAAAARIAKDKQLEIDASEIRIRAERRLGEMLIEQKNGEGLNKGAAGSVVTGTHREPVMDDKPTLAEIGISKNLSSRAQAIAAIPAEDFEVTLDEHRAQQQAVTVATMQKLADKGKEHATKDEKESNDVNAKEDYSEKVTAQAIADKAMFFLTQIKPKMEGRKEAFESVIAWCKKQIKEAK